MASKVWQLAFASLTLSMVTAMPGSLQTIDASQAKVKEIGNFAVQEIDETIDSERRSSLIRIVKVQTQVVSGINYYMTFDMGETNCLKEEDNNECLFSGGNVRECEVVVWDQPWSNTRRLTHQSCLDKVSRKRSPKTEHRNHLLGGATKMDQDSKEVGAAAAFAVEEMNARTNSLNRLVLENIVKAHRQTVSGFKYKLQVKMGLSTCRNNDKNRGLTIDQCPLDKKADLELCKFEVLQQAWHKPQFQLINFKCHSVDQASNHSKTHSRHSKPKHLLGGDGHDLHRDMFKDFMKTYSKVYSSTKEEHKRFSIFLENMKKAKKIQYHEKGTAKYGVTKFSDMPEEEFRKYYLTPKWDQSPDPRLGVASIPADQAPPAWDWRDHGLVTPVKNQGQCGSCWAFSTTGNIEGQWALKKKSLVDLSEQELVDCDKLDDGCEGGLPSNAYQEIMRLGGLDTETKYPYDAEDEKCKFHLSDARIYINGSLNISSDEADMTSWLAKNGPISIGINANAMQFYMGGVSHPWSFLCNPDSLDHGVLIVGYGVKKSLILSDTPYWIVKNSWGPDWGEKGYYLVYRGDGTCGVNMMPTSAVVN